MKGQLEIQLEKNNVSTRVSSPRRVRVNSKQKRDDAHVSDVYLAALLVGLFITLFI